VKGGIEYGVGDGCYLEVEFPRELQIAAGTRAYTGEELLAATGSGSAVASVALTAIYEDFSGSRGKVVFEGCTNTALAGNNDVTRTFTFDMPNIKNPYSEKETSPFNIKIFNSWDSASKTGSLQIAGSSTFVIPESTYATGAVTDIKVTAANYIIQEVT
jgi:hypothetical protein